MQTCWAFREDLLERHWEVAYLVSSVSSNLESIPILALRLIIFGPLPPMHTVLLRIVVRKASFL